MPKTKMLKITDNMILSIFLPSPFIADNTTDSLSILR